MSDVSAGNFAKITLDPDDVYRVVASGVATVVSLYGAPAGTTTVTANSVTFGPYGVNAQLRVTATTGPCTISKIEGRPIEVYDEAITDPEALAAVQAAAGGGGGIVSITENTTLTIADHNGKTLRCSGSQTLTVPEDLGTEFSCIVEMVAAATVSFDPTGSTAIQDSATPAGNTTTRTRTHSNNPSGVVLKSTATANVLSLSGS